MGSVWVALYRAKNGIPDMYDDVGDKTLEKCRQKEIIGLPHKGLKTDLA